MWKYKVFIDDTIPKYLVAPNKPDYITDTHCLWSKLQSDIYEVVVSETLACTHNDIFKQLEFCSVPVSSDVLDLTGRISDLGIVDRPNVVMQDMAAALLSGCDFFVSWDYENIVNVKTIRTAKIIAMLEGFKDIVICTPTMFIM